MSFKKIFKKVDKFAEQFGQEISNEQLQDIIQICMPYFMFLRKTYKFFRIPIEDIKNEIAPFAMSQAFLIQQRRKVSFSYCLQNAFRDCCRQHLKQLDERATGNIISQCDIEESRKGLSGGTRK